MSARWFEAGLAHVSAWGQPAGGRLVHDGFSHSADSGDRASCLPPFGRLAWACSLDSQGA